MKIRQHNTSRHATMTVGQARIAQNARVAAPELHIGIDEVLGMHVGCWSPPVHVGTNVPNGRRTRTLYTSEHGGSGTRRGV